MPEITYEPEDDASMSGINPDSNYGAGTSLWVGVAYFGGNKSDFFRAIMDFDVSDLAGETIVTARLERYVYDIIGEAGATAQIMRCTRPGDWVESQVTWNNYKTGSSWTAGGGDVDVSNPPPVSYAEASSAGWHAISGLGGFVEDALANRGGIVSLIFRLADEVPDAGAEYVFFSTRSALNHPRLIVEYGEAAAGPSGRRLAHEPPALASRRPAREAPPTVAARPAPERRSA